MAQKNFVEIFSLPHFFSNTIYMTQDEFQAKLQEQLQQTIKIVASTTLVNNVDYNLIGNEDILLRILSESEKTLVTSLIRDNKKLFAQDVRFNFIWELVHVGEGLERVYWLSDDHSIKMLVNSDRSVEFEKTY